MPFMSPGACWQAGSARNGAVRGGALEGRPEQIQRLGAFSWCQNVRRIEDLTNRSDLPKPFIREDSDGISKLDGPN